jgi:hypothetical protein
MPLEGVLPHCYSTQKKLSNQIPERMNHLRSRTDEVSNLDAAWSNASSKSLTALDRAAE